MDIEPNNLADILASAGIATAPIGADGKPVVHAEIPPPDYPDDALPKSLADFPPYVSEDENEDILIRGRWLERGGSAFIVSTAGTGKSIHSLQLALSMTAGLPFSGLTPRRPLRFWIFQTEDSPSRITIDREDIIAELSEQHPDVDWRETAKLVKFLPLGGKVGAEFIKHLDYLLHIAELRRESPDVVILNPFMSFIGGPITDGNYVTPFLRGGEINRHASPGLQFVIEKHRVGLLSYHHTPKPPKDEEVKIWLKSAFPEYQGAGSADITNWGRSFITMMRVPEKHGYVCLTAGKNGGELGWTEVAGASRLYLAWSRGDGITGGNRHAWREVPDEELATVSTEVMQAEGNARKVIAEGLRKDVFTASSAEKERFGLSRSLFRTAWKYVTTHLDEFGLSGWRIVAQNGRRAPAFFGLYEAAFRAAQACSDARGENEKIEKIPSADSKSPSADGLADGGGWRRMGDSTAKDGENAITAKNGAFSKNRPSADFARRMAADGGGWTPDRHSPKRGVIPPLRGDTRAADGAERHTPNGFEEWLNGAPDAQPMEEVLF